MPLVLLFTRAVANIMELILIHILTLLAKHVLITENITILSSQVKHNTSFD